MDEASARAVNAEPWKPLPGMVKRQWFSGGKQNEEKAAIWAHVAESEG